MNDLKTIYINIKSQTQRVLHEGRESILISVGANSFLYFAIKEYLEEKCTIILEYLMKIVSL